MASASSDLEFVFDPLPSEALTRFVSDHVVNVNFARTGVSAWHPINFFVKNARGEILGGLLGYVWGGWLHVNFLWVDENLRGKGLGTRKLKRSPGNVAPTPRRWRPLPCRRRPSMPQKATPWSGGWMIIPRATPSCSCRSGWTRKARPDGWISETEARPDAAPEPSGHLAAHPGFLPRCIGRSGSAD
jgi:hypothetical protein